MERWPWRRRCYPGRVAEAPIIEELDRRPPGTNATEMSQPVWQNEDAIVD